MNAPTNLKPTMLPRGDLIPSPTNPRKRKGLDVASLTELAQTMRPPIGILSPILVRHLVQDGETTGLSFVLANEGKYEIIAGERRWRAAEIAHLADVPVIVRQLSDLEVLKIQLIENKQREDLDELEEAEGYEKLMQQTDANGNPYTANTIADAMGVSRSTIYSRMKLLALCQDGRQAFYASRIDASKALLIARIPVEKLQLQALEKAVNTNTFNGEPIGYREFQRFIHEHFMLYLERAPFDISDASLVPKVGSCTDCLNRTGNQADIFEDVDADVCTDIHCHAAKKLAHVLAVQKQYEAQGNKLVTGKEAKKLIPNYMNSPQEHLAERGYLTLDSKVPGDDQKRTIGQLLKEAKLLSPAKDTGLPAVTKIFVENPRNAGEMFETVNIEAATKALREAGFEITMKGKESPNQADDKRAKEREKEKQKLAIENAFRSSLFDTLHARIEADMLDPNSDTFPKLYRMLAVQMWGDSDYYDNQDIIALMRKYTTLPDEQEGQEIDWQSHIAEFGENIPSLTPAQHLMLIIELPLIVQEISTSYHASKAETMLALAKELDIDADGMRKEAAAEHKAAAAVAKKVEKTKPKKKVEPEATPLAAPKVRPAATWPFPTPREAA